MKAENIFKYLPYLLVGGLWVCIYFDIHILPNNNCKIFEQYKKMEFKGIVLRTYSDYDNKGSYTAEIVIGLDTIKYSEWNTKEYMMNFLDNNDSIVKIKNTFDYYIYKSRDKNKVKFIKGHETCESAYKRDL